jgi:chitosanase
MLPPIDTLPAIVQKLNSLFENDTTVPNYNYIEYLPDGRGFTFGKVGFTTATGDGFDVIREYSDSVKNSTLANYLDELQKLAQRNSDDTANLVGFKNAWVAEATQTKYFQDKVAFTLYGKPAIDYCNSLGIESTLGLAIIYDAIVQHGDGKDDDGIKRIFKCTIKTMGGSPSGKTHKNKSCEKIQDSEKEFLKIFLAEREFILQDANNKETREEWSQSVSRIEVFQNLLLADNMNLQSPVVIKSEDWNTVIE